MRVLDDIDRRHLACQRGGIDQRGQSPPPGIGINNRKSNVRIGDAQQVIEEQHVLGVGIRHPGAHSVTGGRAVQATHAGGCPQQPRHDMEGDVGGVRFAVGAEHLHFPARSDCYHLTHQTALADTR